jgi:hypothetical protein
VSVKLDPSITQSYVNVSSTSIRFTGKLDRHTVLGFPTVHIITFCIFSTTCRIKVYYGLLRNKEFFGVGYHPRLLGLGIKSCHQDISQIKITQWTVQNQLFNTFGPAG